MKKLILTSLLCFGVGLTLMGAPAQVPDDNDPQAVRNGSETAVTVQPQNPASRTHARIKYEFTRKTINVSKLVQPKLRLMGKKTIDRLDIEDNAKKIIPGKLPIISDPVPIKPPGHGNSGPLPWDVKNSKNSRE